MRIKDIMETKFASVQADDRLDRILAVFSEKGVASAPVFSRGEFIGIITYADLARHFMARTGMPFIGREPDESKMTAASMARKPAHTLTPDEPVRLALWKIIGSEGCVPVMGAKGLVGIVRPGSVVGFFLAERAKTEIAGKEPGSVKKEQIYNENATSIDRMLEIVARDGEITTRKMAKELGITESSAEDLAKLLGKHRLVETNYSFLTGMVMRRLEHGRN